MVGGGWQVTCTQQGQGLALTSPRDRKAFFLLPSLFPLTCQSSLPLPSPSASQRWQLLQMETLGWTGSSLQWPLTCLQLICGLEPGLLGPHCITSIPRFCGAISDLPLQGA